MLPMDGLSHYQGSQLGEGEFPQVGISGFQGELRRQTGMSQTVKISIFEHL